MTRRSTRWKQDKLAIDKDIRPTRATGSRTVYLEGAKFAYCAFEDHLKHNSFNGNGFVTLSGADIELMNTSEFYLNALHMLKKDGRPKLAVRLLRVLQSGKNRVQTHRDNSSSERLSHGSYRGKRPIWWPKAVTYQRPDRLKMHECIKLLMHMIDQFDGSYNPVDLYADDAMLDSNFRDIVSMIFRVRWLECQQAHSSRQAGVQTLSACSNPDQSPTMAVSATDVSDTTVVREEAEINHTWDTKSHTPFLEVNIAKARLLPMLQETEVNLHQLSGAPTSPDPQYYFGKENIGVSPFKKPFCSCFQPISAGCLTL